VNFPPARAIARCRKNLRALAVLVRRKPGIRIPRLDHELEGKTSWRHPSAAVYQLAQRNLRRLAEVGIRYDHQDGTLWPVDDGGLG